jgi:hypothetical protein
VKPFVDNPRIQRNKAILRSGNRYIYQQADFLFSFPHVGVRWAGGEEDVGVE